MIAPTIENTLGALLIGTAVAVFLFGIVSLQMETYMGTFTEDRLGTKLMAIIVWILELLHTIFILVETYRGTIFYFGNLIGFQHYPYMGAATLIGGLITMIVQTFFCLRVWRALSDPLRYIGAVCGIAAILRGIASVYLGSRVILAKTLLEYRETNGWLIRGLLSMGTAIDVIIAGTMLFFLFQKRSTGFASTSRLLDHLVAYTIRTGLLTSLVSIGVLVSFQTASDTFIWVGFYVVLAKLYSNSLFSALNERRVLRNIVASASSELGSRQIRPQLTNSKLGNAHFNPAISIEMKTTVTRDEQEKDVALYRSRKGSDNLSSNYNMA